jgi:hypothetical protein
LLDAHSIAEIVSSHSSFAVTVAIHDNNDSDEDVDDLFSPRDFHDELANIGAKLFHARDSGVHLMIMLLQH